MSFPSQQNIEVPVIEYTGSWGGQEPSLGLSPSIAVIIDNKMYIARHNCINRFNSSASSSILTISLNKIYGIYTGNISNFSQLNTLTLLDLEIVGTGFGLVNGANTFLSIGANPNLVNLNLPKLRACASLLTITGNTSLTTLSLPSLLACGNDLLIQDNSNLNTINLPILYYVNGNFNINGTNLIATLTLPELKRVNSAINFVNLLVTSLNFAKLQYVYGTLTLSSLANCTTVSLPEIIHLAAVTLSTSTSALTTFTLGSSLKEVTGNFVISSATLTQASVDGILQRLAALDGTNGTTSYNSHTITLTGSSAPPSATGLAAKATLEARGNTVNVNS